MLSLVTGAGASLLTGAFDAARAEMRQNAIRITIRGTPGCRIVPELTQRPGDLEILKKRYSAFFGTNLDRLIADHAIDTVVPAGVNTHACIRVTAIDAYQRDLAVILAREAIGSYDEEHAAVSLRYRTGRSRAFCHCARWLRASRPSDDKKPPAAA